jgi:Uncharacterised protein family (UPF0261)
LCHARRLTTESPKGSVTDTEPRRLHCCPGRDARHEGEGVRVPRRSHPRAGRRRAGCRRRHPRRAADRARRDSPGGGGGGRGGRAGARRRSRSPHGHRGDGPRCSSSCTSAPRRGPTRRHRCARRYRGTGIATRAMRALPVGVPKLMVSTVASGDTSPYVGTTDVTMMHSVVDVAGINRISARIFTNAARALAGLAAGMESPFRRRQAGGRGIDVGRHDPVRNDGPASRSRGSVTTCSSSTRLASAAGRWRS